MLIRWKVTEDTPYRHVDQGTVAETEDELAKQLVADGIAEPVAGKAERAVKPKGEAAVRK
jgi:hypothetical protein